MRKKLPLLLLVILLLVLTACTQNNDTDISPQTTTIIDVYGREVEIPTQIDSIICVGSGALRMVSYLQATELLIGIEEGDKEYQASTKRDYAYAEAELFQTLAPIGKGGGTAYTAYAEEVILANPDVIICGYTEEAAEQLAAETGIPVICVRYESINFIDQSFYAALHLTAEVIGRQDRAAEILSYIDAAKADLISRTQDIADADKPTVYTGAVTFSGAHGFSGTYANFGPFLAISAMNVADETGEKGAFDVDLEKVVEWDPQIIFLDPGNINLVNAEYATNPNYFHSLSAIQNGEIYAMPSFNNYSTNITYALMDAYYAGTVLYPGQFADIDMAIKADEILSFFLGKGFYSDMVADNMGFAKITLGE